MKKIIFIIYASVIAVTGICAWALPQFVNADLCLLPLAVALFLLVIGIALKNGSFYFSGGRIHAFRIFRSGDFKYSKDKNGKGTFVEVDDPMCDHRIRGYTILGYAFIVCGAACIPCAFFLPMNLKWYSIGLIILSYLIGSAVCLYYEVKLRNAFVKAERAKNNQWQKELDEQKKREEMGKWK